MATNQFGRHGTPSHAAHSAGARPAARPARPAASVPPVGGHAAGHVTDAAGGQRLTTIHAGQGVRITIRENASEAADAARANALKCSRKRHSSPQLKAVANGARRDGGSHASHAADGPERTNKNIVKVVLMAIGVLLVVFIVVRLIVGLLAGSAESDQQQAARPDEQPTQAEQIANEQQQVEVSVGESVTFQGQSFSIAQAGDTYSVTRDGAVVFNLEGTPTGLVLYNGSLVVPENRDGGWDVVSYMIADGSVPAYVMGEDGNAVGGSGDIQSATLDGNALKVTDSTGATTSVALG